MSNAKHAPGDWHREGNVVWSDACKDRGPVFECRMRTGTHIPANQNEVNAEYIFRAVKSHADLLAALQDLVEQYESWRDLGDAAAEPPDTDAARAAIAKAGGAA